jgi:hypothetical protein
MIIKLPPTLNQLSSLENIIKSDPMLQEHFILDNVWEKISNLSLGQYKRMIALIMNKKRFDLNDMMLQLKFKRNN